MIEKKFTVRNKSGLHVRPAGVLASAMGKYNCDAKVVYNGGTYNAKSVINVLAAAIKKDAEITLIIDGADEVNAMNEATKLIESGLGEGLE